MIGHKGFRIVDYLSLYYNEWFLTMQFNHQIPAAPLLHLAWWRIRESNSSDFLSAKQMTTLAVPFPSNSGRCHPPFVPSYTATKRGIIGFYLQATYKLTGGIHRIRTYTFRFLKPTPLPIGVVSHMVALVGFEPTRHF